MRDLHGIDIELDEYYLGYILNKMKDGRVGYDRDGMEILLDDLTLSKIIASISIGIPLPSCYINTLSEEFHWEAITGHTVFEALNRFVIKENLVLEGLKIKSELNGLSFKDLSEDLIEQLYKTGWNLILMKNRVVNPLSKSEKVKNSCLLQEDIYAIIKGFNG